MPLPSALSLSLLLVLCACDTLSRPVPGRSAAQAPLADTARADVRILRRYGWTPVELLAEDTLPIPVPVTKYLQTRRYLNASHGIGLDFSSHEGQTLQIHSYRIREHPYQAPGPSTEPEGVRAHVLLAKGEVVGAWLSVEEETPGIYPLNIDPATRRPHGR